MSTEAEFIRKLEARGEAGVREDYEKGIVAENRRPLVEKWLTNKDRAKGEERADIHVDLQTRSLRVAERALQQAREANRVARWSAFFTALSGIIAVAALWVSLYYSQK